MLSIHLSLVEGSCNIVVTCGLLEQVWNEGSSEDEVLAMVVRTGLCTTMGTMLLQVTKPPNRFQIHKDPFLRVSPMHD